MLMVLKDVQTSRKIVSAFCKLVLQLGQFIELGEFFGRSLLVAALEVCEKRGNRMS